VTRRVTGAAVALSVALVLTGCGGGADTIVTDEGTLTVEQDGDSITVESSEGSATITGEGGELPEGWPAVVSVPDGGEILSTASVSETGQAGWTASINYPDSRPEEVAEEMAESLEGSGFTSVAEFTTEDGVAASYQGSGLMVSSAVTADGDGATMIVTVVEEE
jgi:hypothetical protein